MFTLFSNNNGGVRLLLGIFALIGAAVLVVIDQVIKFLATTYIKPIGTLEIIPGFLDFTYHGNDGAAFGILSSQTWIFVIITALVCIALIVGLFVYKKHTTLSRMACALIIAGGIGNLIDRVFNNGYVIDYIHVKFFPPIFNFADCLCFYWCSTVVYLCNFLYRFTSQRIICEEKAKERKSKA